MGSPHFQAYDRTLRRMFMLRLVEALEAERGGNFRASLVVNGRTGLPALPAVGEFVGPRPARSRRTDLPAA
jgi:hypothetical protein